MKIAVLIKQTPDTAELPSVAAEDVRKGDIRATLVLNPWDEYAVEEAILLNERFDADTVALSVGGKARWMRLSTRLRWGWLKPSSSTMGNWREAIFGRRRRCWWRLASRG